MVTGETVDLIPHLLRRGMLNIVSNTTSEGAGADNSGPHLSFQEMWTIYTETDMTTAVAALNKIVNGEALMAPIATMAFENDQEVESGILSLAEFSKDYGISVGYGPLEVCSIIRSPLVFQVFAVKYHFLFDVVSQLKPGSHMLDPLLALFCGKSAAEINDSL